MRLDDKRYQLGSYVAVKGLGMRTITGMDLEKVFVSNDEGLPWHFVKPVELTEELMYKIGFVVIKKIDNPHHLDINMSIKINGRYYYSRGIIFDDKSMWSFYGAGIKYLHQLQQLIWIIEPKYEFNLDSYQG
jgi:hypothetical protein